MNSIIKYFQESVQELELVRWPTRQQAVRFSGIVIAFMAVSAVVFGFVDFSLSQLVRILLSVTL